MTDFVIVRASSLSGYADCPRRAAARMFAREIRAAGYQLNELPGSIGAAIGTAVHAAAALTLTEKATTGELGSESAATDVAVEKLREQVATGVMFDRETPALNDGEKQAIRMAQAYRREVAPEIQPIIVEERLEAQVTPAIVLSGQADVIAREPGRVRDLKTGKKQGNHNPQLGAYSLLARTAGIDVAEAAIDFVQRAPIKKPQPDPVRSMHDIAIVETAAANVLRHIESDLKTFREGDVARRIAPGDPWAFMSNPSSMLCSRKWCPAFGTAWCREHKPEETGDE